MKLPKFWQFLLKLAGVIRIEQILKVLETLVLPLHQTPINGRGCTTRTRTPSFGDPSLRFWRPLCYHYTKPLNACMWWFWDIIFFWWNYNRFFYYWFLLNFFFNSIPITIYYNYFIIFFVFCPARKCI